jgi:hypothetical protein
MVLGRCLQRLCRLLVEPRVPKGDGLKTKLTKVVLLAFVLSLSGCARWTNTVKHFVASTVGTQRQITLYTADGRVLRQWKCDCSVEMRGGDAWFITEQGKSVAVMGSVVVEEL